MKLQGKGKQKPGVNYGGLTAYSAVLGWIDVMVDGSLKLLMLYLFL